jgi:halimadienyl-diphosphate synthase
LNVARQKPLEKTPLAATQDYCTQAIIRGVNYLWQHLDELSFGTEAVANPRLPYLWRGKELYMPWRVVHSAVLAVLHQACANEATKN